MNDRRPRTYVYRGNVPLWLVLAVVAPLGLVFLTSLILAVAIVAAGENAASPHHQVASRRDMRRSLLLHDRGPSLSPAWPLPAWSRGTPRCGRS